MTPAHEYAGFPLHYNVEPGLLSTEVESAFKRVTLDQAGRDFVDGQVRNRHGRTKSYCHALLRHFFSDFDVNGILNMYPLHLLSTEQWRPMLGAADRSLLEGSLLDVGAGNGDLTSQLYPLFARADVTEQSWAMRRRLSQRGMKVIDLSDAATRRSYEVVACLNVLDRTARPQSLLASLADRVAAGGQMVVSIPLPLAPFHFLGPRVEAPTEVLNIRGETWEQAAGELVQVLEQAAPGFKLRRLTRAPYLSGGDTGRPLYALDSAICVLARHVTSNARV